MFYSTTELGCYQIVSEIKMVSIFQCDHLFMKPYKQSICPITVGTKFHFYNIGSSDTAPSVKVCCTPTGESSVYRFTVLFPT